MNILKSNLGKTIGQITLLCAFLFATQTPANSQNAEHTSEYNWSGLYAGVHAAYGDSTFTQDATNPAIPHYWHDSEGSWLAGGYLGINFQSENNIVLGFEGDWSFTDTSKLLQYQPDPTNSILARMDSVATLRTRLGFAHDNFLLYGTVGKAWMTGKHDQVLIPTNTINDEIQGWTVGGGVEYGISQRWSMKLEYLHFEFDKFYPQNAQGTTQVAHTYDIEVDTISIGLAYRF